MLLTFSTPQFTCTMGRRVCIQLVVCLSVCLSSFPILSLFFSLSFSLSGCPVRCSTFSPLRLALLILLSSCSCCTSSIEFCGCRYCCCLISLGLWQTRSRSASRQYSPLICLLQSERNSLHIDRGKCLWCVCLACVSVCCVYVLASFHSSNNLQVICISSGWQLASFSGQF